MYIQRTVQQALKDLTKSFPCVVVYGPRQVGKSTTINFTFGGEYPQVTLDDVVLPKCNLDKNNKANKVYNTQWRNTLWEKESGTVQKKSQQ